MARNRRSNSPQSCTRTLFLSTGAILFLWCVITPMLLLNQVEPEPKTFFNNVGLSLADQRAQPVVDPPAFVQVRNTLWTLEDAPRSELANKDWYEKGRMLVDNNRFYLSQAEGRATKESSNITLVSGLFDLGRGDLKESFARSFEVYVERFSNFLAYKYPKIIFIQPEHYHYYVPYLEKNPDYPVYIVNTTIQEIRDFEYFDLVQQVRTKPGWATQAGWLAESPQASMPLYNPMVMSKIKWTRNAARINPFNTDSFLWIDGGHQCNNPEKITQDNDFVFKQYFDKMLITYFDYQPWGEVHGFEQNAFRRYIDTDDKVLRVGRGGIFGGTKEYLEVATEVFMLALGETLRAGYMGTEENIFSILYYRFPELISDYENGEGGNCAIFSEVIYGPPPPPLEEIIRTIGFDLRDIECRGKFEDVKCYDGDTQCPSYVNPEWLTEAKDQYVCNLRGYYCTVNCRNGEVFWASHTCPTVGECPPYGRVPFEVYYSEGEIAPPDQKDHDHVHALKPPAALDLEDEEEFTSSIQRQYSPETRDYIKRNGYDLRGLECEIKDGKETCFLNHRLGRDICPSDITAASLTLAEGQHACQNQPETYCVVSCQDGTDHVFWTAYNKVWCAANPDNCAPQHPGMHIPYDDFVLRHWSEEPRESWPCESFPVSKFQNMKPFTVGVLARGNEIDSLRLAVDSWIKDGFMQFVDEFVFYINDYSDLIGDFLEPFTLPPYNVKLHKSPTNVGILKGISYLIGNATNDHFLFLEKDFRLVESLPCALEQMEAGLKMIDNEVADVVKFRSRYNGGKANWADILYRDQEETVFQRQPNLLCNFYHWIDHPEERWPQHFKVCNTDPLMYCVDAEFCNWTNNPFFINKHWWIENYEKKHWEIRNPPPGFDLETWMNWDEGAWNHRGWTIAEGEGMFKHADVHKFGV